MYSEKQWIIDDAELNLLNFSITELWLMLLYNKCVNPHYKILIMWHPETDKMEMYCLLYSKRSKDLKFIANSSNLNFILVTFANTWNQRVINNWGHDLQMNEWLLLMCQPCQCWQHLLEAGTCVWQMNSNVISHESC